MITSLPLFMIKELSLWALIGIGAAALWVVPLIDLLYKLQFTVHHEAMKNNGNAEWMKIHGKDTGTPKMGGILIWLTVPALLFLFFWNIIFIKVVACIILLVGAYGFADDAFVMAIKNNPRLRALQEEFPWRVSKIALSIALNIVVAVLLIKVVGISSFSFFGLVVPISSLLGILFIAFCSSMSAYATEMIDGIDGLSSGMFILTLSGFVLLMLAYPANFFTSANTTAIAAVGALVGVLIVYLYFNIPPARFYMGGPGAMPMGPVFLALALYGNVMPAFCILMIPYALDLASSAAQILSMKFFKKRIFKIAPVHHHFEAIGWPGSKVVMRFWLFNGALVFLALAVQLFFGS